MKSNIEDLDILNRLWLAGVEFNRDITKLRKEIFEVRIGLLEAFQRRRIKHIEEEFIKLNSRLFYFENLEIQDFRDDTMCRVLYDKKLMDLKDNEKIIQGVEINDEFITSFMQDWRSLPSTELTDIEIVNVNSFNELTDDEKTIELEKIEKMIHYWRRMRKSILQVIERARINLSILDDRIITKYSQANQLKAMTVSIVSIFIAIISILFSFIRNW